MQRSAIGTATGLRALVLTGLLMGTSAAQAALWWKDVSHSCLRPGVGQVSAKLEGIPWGQSWENACNGSAAPALNRFGASGRPDRCEKDAPWNTGIWGKWTVRDDPRCPDPNRLRWTDWKRAGCFGPNRQVYSARLMGSRDWEGDCAVTDTSEVSGREGWGTPDRCVKDAIPTGIWGEWYREGEACRVPLTWGTFRDNGCVKDMGTPDGNAGGVSLQGKRSYSAVLYNVGGDWTEACRFAPAVVAGPGVRGRAEFEHPTACVVADADRAVGYVAGAVFGAATSLITSPASPTAAAAAGAAVGVATTAATEGLLAAVNTDLNVWGVFWVDDATCGPVQAHPPLDETGRVRLPTGEIVRATGSPVVARTAGRTAPRGDAPGACPTTARALRGTGGSLACVCLPAQTAGGRVWGSGPYTDDSRICRAAVHAGAIPASGGTVRVTATAGQGAYQGSLRNGIATDPYGAWPGGFRVDRP
jgi:hypothetical protein